MAPNATGRVAAKVLGIDLDYRNEHQEPLVSGGASISSVETYVEREPTVAEWFSQFRPTGAGVKHYLRSLFPFWNWIFHYNLTWLLGDVIAGVTVGFVVIPQGMAYAILAKLPPEYGLYTSFVGFLLYWAFATSKDITIGTVAVMSTIVGNIVIKVQDEHPEMKAPAIASALAVISGAVLLFIGLIRAGWIVEFIPLVAITSFMTGAAISIGVGQVPGMMGIPNINTRGATYRVIIDTLKGLPNTKLDAAIGLTALTMLYGIRAFCNFMTKKQPNKKKLWFFLSTLRMAFVILLYILISYLVNKHVKDAKKAKFKILGKVPRGFQHAGAPDMNSELLAAVAPDLPLTIIVLILEHIAISKSFGRINNYTINPSQELVAVGFTNLLGPFLGAYPATGSFSRTAIKSKAGVRTPLAGIFTAVIVLLALYALTRVFFYIPSAALSAVIIHAVGDLITPPNVVYQFWETSPLEVLIFFGGVLLTIFTNIENGIYLTMCASLALLLWRHLMARGAFLGKVRIYRATHDTIGKENDAYGSQGGKIAREAYLPVNHRDGSNPTLDFEQPYPGVFIFRFEEGFTYLNQQRYMDALVGHVQRVARPTKLDRFAKIGDRPWNDPGPRRGKPVNLEDDRTILRAIILDFSSVSHVDVTSIQGLVDVRNQLDRYAAPEVVEWHFAAINNRWTKRALTTAGFGYISTERVRARSHWTPVYSFAAVGDADNSPEAQRKPAADLEAGADHIHSSNNEKNAAFPPKVTAVHGQNRPYFHVDVQAAVESAIAGVESKLAQTTSTDSNVGVTHEQPDKSLG
ncbi:kinase subdomain-containing protein [Aaosphaeria arxii CBS 175.79]|uniref:Kinase subdomain-containing protein n=1 Tax=Aaosphaeria arxii CBS 175.79 TaxID=1450172 RepID=A0A6A5XXB7_9PLEO|nr:kinase subdomain-containing protein [Aaosphaeria arxii CBS 175.79]KAF2017812.1 kinase subdomain-containing protein [Aaosphaeria arxii CBS 175.79]